jgi:hypothetical protein
MKTAPQSCWIRESPWKESTDPPVKIPGAFCGGFSIPRAGQISSRTNRNCPRNHRIDHWGGYERCFIQQSRAQILALLMDGPAPIDH